jgi:hypothetical protein
MPTGGDVSGKFICSHPVMVHTGTRPDRNAAATPD